MRFKIGSAYLMVLGAVTSLFGGLELAFSLVGREITTGFLRVPGSIWGFWKGLILFFSGAFMATGAVELRDIHGLGKAVLGSIMLWIVAGCDIFGRILGSIPGEEGWFNSLEGFLETYGPPYEPALWLLPFSLVIVYFIVKSR